MGADAKLECNIVDIKQVPNSAAQLVSVEFKLGQRTWHKGFRLLYDRTISMEEFKREIVRAGPFPDNPEDFLVYVKQEADQPFVLEVELPEFIEKATDNIEHKGDN